MANKRNSKVGENKSEIVRAIPLACADEDAAVELMEELRWGDEPACPHCGAMGVMENGRAAVYKMTKRGSDERNDRYLWRCRECGKQYTVRVGTVMEDSPIPLRHWAYAFWRASTSKKGVSALEIKRQTGLTYKSALFLMHRIRYAMTETPTRALAGDVQVDETYVGGKVRPGPMRQQAYMSSAKRDKAGRRYPRHGWRVNKTPVVALVEPNGDARARVVTNVTGNNLKAAIREHVDRSARIMTDEATMYKGIGKEFEGGHETVKHSAQEYARGDVTTNTVEAFFAILKRGVYGIWHNVSPEHLHRYVAAAQFRWNTRRLDDGERPARAIRGAEGKRLMYAAPTSR